MNDAIPICRSIFKHWIYEDAEYFKVWVTMLADASYIKTPKMVLYEKTLVEQNYGEFIFGYKKWSKKCNISYQRLRGLMDKLISADMIKLKTKTNRFSLYEIVNYAKFNSQQTNTEQGLQGNDNTPVTTQQQPSNIPVTTTKKDKKEKNDKKKDILSKFDAFWFQYPKKVAKQDAVKAWNKIQEEDIQSLMDGLMVAKCCNDWTKENGKYIPNAATWLNGRRWEDEYSPPQKTPIDNEREVRKRMAIEFDRRNGLSVNRNGKNQLFSIES